jgi:hypothetical protein
MFCLDCTKVVQSKLKGIYVQLEYEKISSKQKDKREASPPRNFVTSHRDGKKSSPFIPPRKGAGC